MTILEAINFKTPLVLRDLELYKDILFGHHMQASDNDGFVQCLNVLKNESGNLCEVSAGISDFK